LKKKASEVVTDKMAMSEAMMMEREREVEEGRKV
jgi:hypothetical protein